MKIHARNSRLGIVHDHTNVLCASAHRSPANQRTPPSHLARIAPQPHVAFFLSSRRRHTRYWRDWSSDVCSSDLFDPEIQTPRSGWVALVRPNVISMDTRTGIFFRELENPGNVTGWIADRQGVIRIGVRMKDGRQTIIYRENEKANWRALRGLDDELLKLAPMGLNDQGTEHYVAKVGSN